MSGPSYEAHQFEGDYFLDVGGVFRLCTQNAPITMLATDSENGGFAVTAANSVNLSCGTACLDMAAGGATGGQVLVTGGMTGAVVLACGLPAAGAGLALTPDEVTLSIGPPGVGASIKLSLTAITLQIGPTKLTLTPTGISEELVEVKRSLAATGHTLTAVESEVAVGVTGVNISAPMVSTKAEATLTEKSALSDVSATAVRNVKAGLLNLG